MGPSQRQRRAVILQGSLTILAPQGSVHPGPAGATQEPMFTMQMGKDKETEKEEKARERMAPGVGHTLLWSCVEGLKRRFLEVL